MAGYVPDSKAVDWCTPPEVVEKVRAALGGGIDLDPCSNVRSVVCAGTEIMLPSPGAEAQASVHGSPRTVLGDGLAVPWAGRVFVNPPFGSALATWAKKAAEEAAGGAEVVLLAPARVDTRWWHESVPKASALCFLKGRVRFLGAPASAPFPVALVYYGPSAWRFRAAMAPSGMVVSP